MVTNVLYIVTIYFETDYIKTTLKSFFRSRYGFLKSIINYFGGNKEFFQIATIGRDVHFVMLAKIYSRKYETCTDSRGGGGYSLVWAI